MIKMAFKMEIQDFGFKYFLFSYLELSAALRNKLLNFYIIFRNLILTFDCY